MICTTCNVAHERTYARMLGEKLAAEAPAPDEAFVRRVATVRHVRGHVYFVGHRVLERPNWATLASELRERGAT